MSELSKAENKPDAATRDLWQVAVVGDAVQLADVLARGADINAGNPAGFTALMLAAYHGHRAVVLALIERGANVNAGDRMTALKLAGDAGHEEIARILVAHGAERKPRRRAPVTPVRVIEEEEFEEVSELVVAPVRKAPEVRTLHEPPEIWDMVHEAPAHFDSRSSFREHFNSRNSLMLVATLFVIAGGTLIWFSVLRDWSWSTAASSQQNDTTAKTVARTQPSGTRTTVSSAAQPNTARQVSAVGNNATASTVKPTISDKTASNSTQTGADSGASNAVGVPVASVRTPAQYSVKPRRKNPGAATVGTDQTAVPASSPATDSASATRTNSKEPAQTSASPDRKSENEKSGSTNGPVAPTTGKGQSRARKEGNSPLSPELIGPAKPSASPKPKVIPWP
jgi:hypothetical protein